VDRIGYMITDISLDNSYETDLATSFKSEKSLNLAASWIKEYQTKHDSCMGRSRKTTILHLWLLEVQPFNENKLEIRLRSGKELGFRNKLWDCESLLGLLHAF
jgi:hypothetical protein